MNAKQNSKLASYSATQAVLRALPEIAGVPGLPVELANLSVRMGEINSLAQTQQDAVRGKRARRDELLAAMADAAVEVATMVAAYADKQKLTELAHRVRLIPSDFARTRKPSRPVLARSVVDAARAVLPELASYGVTAGMLDSLDTLINVAIEGLHQPRSGIVEKKTATLRLAALFAQVDALLEGQIDRLVYPLRKTNPAFYARYVSARSIIDHPGTRGPAAAATPVGPPQAVAKQAA